MNRHAGVQQWPTLGRQALLRVQDAGHAAGEAALVVAQGGVREPGAFVQAGDEGEAHADILRSLGEGPAERQRVVIGLAVGLGVQVVEFAHLGVAAFQQFEKQLAGHGAQLLGADAQGHAVHAVTPAPEVVLAAVAALGQAGKGALKGVAVAVHQTRP